MLKRHAPNIQGPGLGKGRLARLKNILFRKRGGGGWGTAPVLFWNGVVKFRKSGQGPGGREMSVKEKTVSTISAQMSRHARQDKRLNMGDLARKGCDCAADLDSLTACRCSWERGLRGTIKLGTERAFLDALSVVLVLAGRG